MPSWRRYDGMESLSTQVAANVRAEMARQRKRQSDLGDVLGLTQGAVSKRMSGTVALDVNEVGKIAEFLGVPVSALLGDTVSTA
jgi:transcriptional regulator with XRE-family HTH domain